MGRHVKVHSSGAVKLDWPGVRLDFDNPISQTLSIQVRMIGNGSSFGYRLTAISEGVDQRSIYNNNDDEGEDRFFLATPPGKKIANYPLLTLDGVSAVSKLDPKKSYKLSLWKRDDPFHGGAQILGLAVDRTCTCAPAETFLTSNKQSRLIEFVGDSNTVGFGITSPKTGFVQHLFCGLLCTKYLKKPVNLIKTTDTTKAWGHRVATELDADYHIIAWSGIGATHSVIVEGNTNMTQAYSRVLASDPSTDVAPGSDSLGASPDAVVVYIGQNDMVMTSNPAKFKNGFSQLLQKIRSYRPLPTPIVVIIPSRDTKLAAQRSKSSNRQIAGALNQIWTQVVKEQVEREAHETDVDNIGPCTHILEANHDPPLSGTRSSDDFGMIFHWNVSSNDKWAKWVVPRLKNILNWK